MTKELQNRIDSSNYVVIEPGDYIVSSLYLHSNMTLELKKGARLIATTNEKEYKDIPTRVAGIEMDWYPAVLNCINCENVTIKGEGEINGQGPYWYNKYWGMDQKGGMRKEYDARGLRFACDYDCKRPRNLLVSKSRNIRIEGITLKDSGFWNLHVLYSSFVTIYGIQIHSENDNGPSTDGIDIDSSHDVLIDHVKTWCNDDSICVKSGRDSDGILVGIPSYNIRIINSKIYSGFGITIGSEVSGGVYDVSIDSIEFNGSDCGFRIKSSHARKGYIRNIHISNLECTNVKYLFHMNLNWNPSYCRCVLPEDYKGNLPIHYQKLIREAIGEDTKVENISISNVNSTYREDYHGISRVFHLEGFDNQPISSIMITNLKARAFEYGVICNTKDLVIHNSSFDITGEYNPLNDSYDNR